MFIEKNGKVLSFGANTCGQLGLGHCSDVKYPVINPWLDDIVMISKGTHHSLFLDIGGGCWSCGEGNYGQLGLGSYVTTSNIPVKIDFSNKIIHISCGGFTSMIIDENFDLYVFGHNTYGELCLGHKNHVYIPTKCEYIENVKKVFCGSGDSHTFLIDNNDEIWCFGSNYFGELGLGHRRGVSKPTKFNFIYKVLDIKLGSTFTLILDDEKRVWSFGENTFGQLGYHTSGQKGTEPKRINIYNIVKISAGIFHSLLLDDSGDVYTFGRSDMVGHGIYDPKVVDEIKEENMDCVIDKKGYYAVVYTPIKIKNIPKISDIHCNYLSSFLCGGEKVFCFGDNDRFNLGFEGGSEFNEKILSPILNPNLNVIVIDVMINKKRFDNTKSAANIPIKSFI